MDITPSELLLQVQEMADPDSAQEFDDDTERLRAIMDHISGNLIIEDCADWADDIG